MATNHYFNNFFSSQEQQLLDDLVSESVKIYGLDVYYLPRNINTQSAIFREATITVYDTAILVDMYVKNLYNFGGDGKFLSKFGLEIRDEITFTIAKTTFLSEVAKYDHELRPNEGDLIYFPLNKKVFQIKFVDHEAIFYQLGSIHSYDLTCDLFEYNNEIFATGIPDIDVKYNNYSTDMLSYMLLDTNGNLLLTTENEYLTQAEYNVGNIDPNAMNSVFDSGDNNIIDFSESNPFSEQGAKY